MSYKVFISQPMKGRSDEDVLAERERIIDVVLAMNPEATIIDSFIETGDYSPVKMLGMSLEKLSEADAAVFAPGWQEGRGCCIEHEVCVQYGIHILIE